MRISVAFHCFKRFEFKQYPMFFREDELYTSEVYFTSRMNL